MERSMLDAWMKAKRDARVIKAERIDRFRAAVAERDERQKALEAQAKALLSREVTV